MSTDDGDGWSLVQKRTRGKKHPSDNLPSSADSSTAVTLFKSSADSATNALFSKIEYISSRRPFAELHSPAYNTPNGYTFHIPGETMYFSYIRILP